MRLSTRGCLTGQIRYKFALIPAVLSACVLFGIGNACAADAEESAGQVMKATNGLSGKEWPSHGFDDAGTRFSPLDQINSGNIKKLGLTWVYDLESTRGIQATPIVVGGTMYVSAAWSVVHAIDVRTGKKLWTYDPNVPRETGKKACCDVVNRGVAVDKDIVYVGTLDGRLVAIAARTGKMVWEQDTIVDRSRPYTVTGAPRVFRGNVIVGNSGAELGVRGYITAYDAATGRQKWRWFTVPGDPSKPFEDESMAKAAKTWDPAGEYWKVGGGGTVWNSMVFDPDLGLMYIGTGNGSPWPHRLRSPGGGDNLYLSSIVALDPETGAYVWHYQETPGDNWDYTATQDLILADIKIDGKLRKVLLHAPKNGFFFVVDRTNGEFISAKNFVPVNWATGYGKDGRPVEISDARSSDKPYEAIPGPFGGHNWQSMSFSPLTGLAYFPAQHVPMVLQDDKSWSYNSKEPGQAMSGIGWNLGTRLNAVAPRSKAFGRLIAWDPVRQAEVWRHEHVSPSNGGTLVTAGNVVFEGTADGRFIAFNAVTGDKLWESPMGSGVIAAPVTYEVDGVQYVSIAAGWGGGYGQTQQVSERNSQGMVYTFSIGGKAPMPKFTKYSRGALISGVKYNPDDMAEGQSLYVGNCVFCHGVPGVDKGGNIPNLGYVDGAIIENLDKFVFNGPFVSRGMPDFTGKLTDGEVIKIKAFIQGTADSIRPVKH